MATNKKGFPVALGGVLAALTLVFMYLAAIIPGFELTMFAISSVFVAVMVIEAGPVKGFWLFVAVSIVGFILVPNKIAIAPYLMFFGYYGIAKYFIEKLNKKVLETIIKTVLFLVTFGLGLYLFSAVFLGEIKIPEYPIPILAIGAVIVFLVYDKIYSIIIGIYMNNIRSRIK